ncbi:MAG: hypothetical protein AAF243_10900 [Cyanobacteria bacterium P01_A01_bin.137]
MLPTMYDLPSEYSEGLPEEFHDLQPQLLSRTLYLLHYGRENWFSASDLNMYYDVNLLWGPDSQTLHLRGYYGLDSDKAVNLMLPSGRLRIFVNGSDR